MAGERPYAVHVIRGWTKEGLAQNLSAAIAGYHREAIISVRTGIDFQFFWPFRRNWAIVVAERPPEAPPA